MLGMTVKGQYFRAKLVINHLRNAQYPVLARAGAFMRGVARRLIKRRKSRIVVQEIDGRPIRFELNASKPGTPPYTHRTGTQRGLKDAILYAVGPKSVVIGPTAQVVGHIGHTHEFGGHEDAVEGHRIKNNWKLRPGGHGPIRMEGRRPVFARLWTPKQVRRATRIGKKLIGAAGWTQTKPDRNYPPRPFMGPALQIAKDRLPAFWSNALRKAG